MPPEFWILPSYLPMHPGLQNFLFYNYIIELLILLFLFVEIYAAKMWCYCRLVYLPLSYLYGKRFVCPITPLIQQLREELHTQPYNQINWRKVRHLCAKVIPPSFGINVFKKIMMKNNILKNKLLFLIPNPIFQMQTPFGFYKKTIKMN